MKHSHSCPKCNGQNILAARGETQAYGIGDNVRAGIAKQAIVTKYVCTDCGYIEEWLDKDELEKLKKYYEKKNRL
ncbi:MAG: hypothetical protein J6Q72_07915 [Clostridia bacterium]|jgi:predicted RNA-binding Zn-ribbon protein involved in translation (DUF1610 family)|nr:hypothetical protein [Clostridia bacterium]